jgi:hypothetical protein
LQGHSFRQKVLENGDFQERDNFSLFLGRHSSKFSNPFP